MGIQRSARRRPPAPGRERGGAYDPQKIAALHVSTRRVGRPPSICHTLSRIRRGMASSVLVVDDDPNLVRLMSKFLKLEGFAPVPAANGQEALAYLRGGGDASVILLDLRMPVMDGWAFRHEQRQDPGLATNPLVVLSRVDSQPVHVLD